MDFTWKQFTTKVEGMADGAFRKSLATKGRLVKGEEKLDRSKGIHMEENLLKAAGDEATIERFWSEYIQVGPVKV